MIDPRLVRYLSASRERVVITVGVMLTLSVCPGGGMSAIDDNAEARLAALESVWYEVIEAVQAGRTGGLACPECGHPSLEVEESAGRTTVRCPGCSRLVEVAIASA